MMELLLLQDLKVKLDLMTANTQNYSHPCSLPTIIQEMLYCKMDNDDLYCFDAIFT